MRVIKGIASLAVILVLWDLGYCFAIDKPPPPEETTGVAVEHMVYFSGPRYIDAVLLTNHRNKPVRAAVVEIDGQAISGVGLATQWRPASLTRLVLGYLVHLGTHGLEMPAEREVYLKPGETLTVTGRRNLAISSTIVSLDGQKHEFIFGDQTPLP